MGLTVKEKKVMRAVLSACDGASGCLIAPDALLSKIKEGEKSGDKNAMTQTEMEKIVRVLELDDYFDVVPCQKKGETLYCFTLHVKGTAFEREQEQTKRYLYFKLAVTVGFAVLSFIVGRVLIAIFN